VGNPAVDAVFFQHAADCICRTFVLAGITDENAMTHLAERYGTGLGRTFMTGSKLKSN
jgi:hypothetical protein